MAPEGDVIKKPCEHKPLGVLILVTESIQDSAVKTLLRNGIVRNDETQTQNIVSEMYIIKFFTVNDE